MYSMTRTIMHVYHITGLGLTTQIVGAKSLRDPDDILIVHMCLLALALSPMRPKSLLTSITALLTNVYL